MTLPREVREDFPLFARRPEIVYLDSAATSQKPRAVLDAMRRFYETSNANVRRGIHRLGEEATEALEEAREAVRPFVRARSAQEVVFTRGTTESINLVAQGWAAPRLRPGDEIVATELEHHSNLLPWQRAANEAGATLRLVPVSAAGELRPIDVERLVGPRTRLVAFSHASNVLGAILPAARIARAARDRGAAVLIDAAQTVPHLPVDVQELGCDFLAFSAHKMLGPTGIGVLWARRERLEEMEPLLLGGGMVREVGEDRSTWLDPPWRLEAGTPPIAEAVGLRAAIEYLEALGMDAVRAHDRELVSHAVERLAAVTGLRLHGVCRARSAHRRPELHGSRRAPARRLDVPGSARHLRTRGQSLRPTAHAPAGRVRHSARQPAGVQRPRRRRRARPRPGGSAIRSRPVTV